MTANKDNKGDYMDNITVYSKVRITSENLPEVLKNMQNVLGKISRSKKSSHDFLYAAGIVTSKGDLKKVYK